VSGDQFAVVATEDGGALLAVIDGLGHGPEAETAAREAVRVVTSSSSQSALGVLHACHEALGRTRGAVMSIVRVQEAALTWAGVGNVEAVFVPGPQSAGRRRRLVCAGGVVGYSLPVVREFGGPIARGDLVVLATDGLREDFADHIDVASSPETLVRELIARCRGARDDVLVLAARYDGRAP
jgi:serine/threonine protein phosphatase PrpC